MDTQLKRQVSEERALARIGKAKLSWSQLTISLRDGAPLIGVELEGEGLCALLDLAATCTCRSHGSQRYCQFT